jgi:hypothetical protein
LASCFGQAPMSKNLGRSISMTFAIMRSSAPFRYASIA